MFQKKICFLIGAVILFIMFVGLLEQGEAQQKYPTKAIEIICGASAGGSNDLSARLMAAYLGKKWGVPINVVGKPGGNTIPAQIELYNSKPDGYTTFLDGDSWTSILSVVQKNLPFTVMDRTFLGTFTISPLIFVVPFNSPIKSMKDAEAEVKKDPGNFTWTTLGGAAANDFAGLKFLKAIGVDPQKTKPVATKGGSDAVAVTASGTAKFCVSSVTAALPAVQGKILRPLAVVTTKRSPMFPDVPTAAEAGYPTVVWQARFGPSGPPKIPSYVVEVWEKGLEEMVQDAEFMTQLSRLGQMPYYLNSRGTRELVLKEIEEAKDVMGMK